jgi:uncharacterized LabA/DUF88 family protein
MHGGIAIMMDGGFVRYKLRSALARPISADDIERLAIALLQYPKVAPYSLYRVFYYDALPYSRPATNPISQERIDFGSTPIARSMMRLLDEVELKENFALRKGFLLLQGWKLNAKTERSLRQQTTLQASDIEPNLSQKGVDMRIGLDIAWISIKALVDAILLVTADSDFIPAMKFARKEGIRLILYSFDQSVVRDLKAHSDIVIPGGEISLASA